MPVYGPNLDIASGALWDFPLMSDTQGEQAKYTSKNDASLRIKNLVSNRAESDCIRMLVQASCLTRLGNALRKNPDGDPFIVSAIYVDDQLAQHGTTCTG